MTNLDKIFNEYIRKRDGADGWGVCATCGQSFMLDQLECGHFISRSFKCIEYDSSNVHLQCISCNRQVPTPQKIKMAYKSFMIEKYGEGMIEELNIKKNRLYRKPDLEIIEKYYKQKLKEL